MSLAPIIVFCYNRPEHLKETIVALSKNPEAKNSDLIIFSDGPKQFEPAISEDMTERQKKEEIEICNKKNEQSRYDVETVRSYIHSIPEKHFFASVDIKESKQNKGLANSVISGVDSVIKKYGRVIVVEDDAVCSPQFLKFMNGALDFYRDIDSKIWFIGGYCPVLDIPKDYPYNFYKMGRGSSYAWATWLDRWEKVDWSLNNYKAFQYNFYKRRQFNRFGQDRSEMLDCQVGHLIDSWAIRFSYAMFCNKMFAILPTKSLIKTIGRDGTGTHAKSESHDFDTELNCEETDYKFENVDMDNRIVVQHKSYFKRGKVYLLKQFIKNNLFNKG